MKTVKKNKTTKPTLLLSPILFFIIGIIEIFLFTVTWSYFSTHHFFDPTGRGGLHLLNLQFTFLEYEIIIFIGYSIILKIVKPERFKKTTRLIFNIISLIIIILFIAGLLYFANFWQDPSLYAKPPYIPGYPNLLY